MKSLALVVLVLIASALLVTVVVAESFEPFSVPLGAPPEPLPADFEAQPSGAKSLPAGAVLLTFAAPDLSGLAVPAHLSRPQAQDLAVSLFARQAAGVTQQLAEMQAHGGIQSFEARPELLAIAVQPGTEPLERLAHLQDVVSLVRPEDGAYVCGAQAAGALAEALVGRSHVALNRSQATPAALNSNPAIHAYVPPGASDSSWTNVYGYTTPSVNVSMRIVRAGVVVATQTTSSGSDGYYELDPYWQQCPAARYSWALRAGDVVEVTAAGNTASTTVVSLSAWLDPSMDMVMGKTTGNRAIRLGLWQWSSAPCNWQWYEASTTSNAAGSFSTSFSGQTDVKRDADVRVEVQDAQGNSTEYYFGAFQLYMSFGSSGVYGTLKPGESVKATLWRSSGQVAEASGRTAPDGYFSIYFGTSVNPGDFVQVTGGGHTITFFPTQVSGSFDPVTDAFTGVTGVARRVRVDRSRQTGDYNLSPSCNYESACGAATADNAGNFAAQMGVDVLRGDYAYLNVYDNEQNYQYSARYPAPLIGTEVRTGYVSGYWGRPGRSLLLAFRTAAGSVKATASAWAGSYDGFFSAWSDSPLQPGETVQVSEGGSTESMTVQDVQATLDDDTGRLSAYTTGGHAQVRTLDFRRDLGYSEYSCRETDLPSGYSTIPTGGMQIGPLDTAIISLRGFDGHHTVRWARSFGVHMEKGTSSLFGYSETPYDTVELRWQRSGGTLATQTVGSDAWGNFWTNWYTPGGFQTGDFVSVAAVGREDSASIIVPRLSVQLDGANNAVTGEGPGGEKVWAGLMRVSRNSTYSTSQRTDVSYDGWYRASFNGWTWSSDCSAVSVNHRCAQGYVQYYTPESHDVYAYTPYPQPLPADSYENDNTPDVASTYATLQTHTFHVENDQDWVGLTVSQAAIDTKTQYRLKTQNLGWGMDTYLSLYSPAGVLLASNDDSGGTLASLITWTPTEPGRYYLMVRPFSSSSTNYCDASYDLSIFAAPVRLRLPFVAR